MADHATKNENCFMEDCCLPAEVNVKVQETKDTMRSNTFSHSNNNNNGETRGQFSTWSSSKQRRGRKLPTTVPSTPQENKPSPRTPKSSRKRGNNPYLYVTNAYMSTRGLIEEVNRRLLSMKRSTKALLGPPLFLAIALSSYGIALVARNTMVLLNGQLHKLPRTPPLSVELPEPRQARLSGLDSESAEEEAVGILEAITNSAPSHTVDVLSIGSNSRWEYVETQRQTWAHPSAIRHFFGIHEGFHTPHESPLEPCGGPHEKVMADQCDTADATIRRQPPVMTRRDMFLDQSAGWLCAQRRPAIGLGDVLANTYPPRGNVSLPDWLLLVDDDSVFHMDVFNLSVSQLQPDDVHVLAGSHIFWEMGRDWPYGGSGLALSRGAMRRLLMPLHCDFDEMRRKQEEEELLEGKERGRFFRRVASPTPRVNSFPSSSQDKRSSRSSARNTPENTTELSNNQTLEDQAYVSHACTTLLRNQAYELDNYTPGMSLADLMLHIATKRKPFCWHSDWMTGWFFSSYVLMGWTIPRFPKCPAPWDCQPKERDIKGRCRREMLMCHYQTPEMMRESVES